MTPRSRPCAMRRTARPRPSLCTRSPTGTGAYSSWPRARTTPVLAAWDSLYAALGQDVKLDTTFSAALAKDAEDTQFGLSRIIADRVGAQLLDMVTNGRTQRSGRQHQARVRSASGGPASAWVVALPFTACLFMPDHVFRSAVRWRLGLSVLPQSSATCACLCGQDLTGRTPHGLPQAQHLHPPATRRHRPGLAPRATQGWRVVRHGAAATPHDPPGGTGPGGNAQQRRPSRHHSHPRDRHCPGRLRHPPRHGRPLPR